MKKNYSERYPKIDWKTTFELTDGKIMVRYYHAPHASKVRYNLKKRMDVKKIISILPQRNLPHTDHPHLLGYNGNEEV